MHSQYRPDIVALLQPETPLERQLLRDEVFLEGLLWGKPRFGHPEGTVLQHVREVLDNIDRLPVGDSVRERLRLIAFAHDTFKYSEKTEYPRDWSKHHGVLARQYMQQFTEDEGVLKVLQWHDEAFYSWRCIHVYLSPDKGWQRLRRLLERIGDDLQLYYYFFKCDTETGDKNQEPLRWFEEVVAES